MVIKIWENKRPTKYRWFLQGLLLRLPLEIENWFDKAWKRWFSYGKLVGVTAHADLNAFLTPRCAEFFFLHCCSRWLSHTLFLGTVIYDRRVARSMNGVVPALWVQFLHHMSQIWIWSVQTYPREEIRDYRFQDFLKDFIYLIKNRI